MRWTGTGRDICMEQITIKEIAKICGVGVSTVSRAINNHPDINPDTKKKIMDTIAKYQYIPNNSARNLKRSESNTIAVLTKGISNPLFGKMIQMLERDILGKQYIFVLQQVDEEENEIEVAIRIEKEKRLKGIIFLGGDSHLGEDLLQKLTVPFVYCTVNAELSDALDNFGVVAINDEAESYRMVDYLCKMGHRRIVILTSIGRTSSIGKLRLNGYRRALEENGIPYDESLVVSVEPGQNTYTMQSGYEETKALLERKLPFTAVFAISDTIAIGACKAIFDAGLSVPEDVSVAGFDGLELASYYHPSLTTIKQPIKEMTMEASRILFELINEKTGRKYREFNGRLLEGQSVKRIDE